jgi:hypothetical protein
MVCLTVPHALSSPHLRSATPSSTPRRQHSVTTGCTTTVTMTPPNMSLLSLSPSPVRGLNEKRSGSCLPSSASFNSEWDGGRADQLIDDSFFGVNSQIDRNAFIEDETLLQKESNEGESTGSENTHDMTTCDGLTMTCSLFDQKSNQIFTASQPQPQSLSPNEVEACLTDPVHGRKARGGHGLLKVSPWPAGGQPVVVFDPIGHPKSYAYDSVGKAPPLSDEVAEPRPPHHSGTKCVRNRTTLGLC